MTVVGLVILVVIIAGFILSIAAQRHGEADRPRSGWRRTEEVFKDPSTDRLMRVWVDPGSGSRHYIPER